MKRAFLNHTKTFKPGYDASVGMRVSYGFVGLFLMRRCAEGAALATAITLCVGLLYVYMVEMSMWRTNVRLDI